MIQDIEILQIALQPFGYKITKEESGPMDSGVVVFSNDKKIFEITKDRSQWFLGGKKEDLEPLGLWRAFDDTHEFKNALLGFLNA